MPTIGSLTYTLVAKTDGFKQGLAGSSRELANQRRLFLRTRTPAEAYQTAVSKLEHDLAKARISQDVFNRSLRQAQIELGKSSAAGALSSGSLTAMRSALNNSATAARAARIATLGFGAALTATVKTSVDFEQSLTESTAIMSDVTATIRDRMTATAQEVAFSTRFSAKEAAESYFFLASAGLNSQQSMQAAGITAQFAQAGNFDLSQATDLLTDAQSALGLSVEDTTRNMENMVRVSDVLVKANTLSNATVEQFSLALTNKAGAALKILNKDIEEGVAVLSVFADQGVKGAEAGTALNIVLRDLTTKAIDNVAEFEKFNVEVFDANGNVNNLADIVGDLEDALEGMSDAQAKATLAELGFTDKSIAFTQALLGSSDQIREYQESLEDATGFTDDVASKSMTDFTRQWNELRATWDTFATTIGPLLVDLLINTGDVFGKSEDDVSLFAKTLAVVVDIVDLLAIVVRAGIAELEFFANVVRIGPIDAFNAWHEQMKVIGRDLLDDTPGQKFLQRLADIKHNIENANQAIQDTTDSIDDMNEAQEGGLSPREMLEAEKREEDAKKALEEVAKSREKAQREEAKRAEDIAKRAQRVTEALRTPMEQIQAEMVEVRDLFLAGMLDDVTAQRAFAQFAARIEKVKGEVMAETARPSTVAAIRAGSIEATRLAQQQVPAEERTAKTNETIAKTVVKQLNEAKAQRELQQNMVSLLTGVSGVVVNAEEA